MRKSIAFLALVIAALFALPATALATTNLTVDADGGDYNIYCLLTGSPSRPENLSFVSTSFPREAWNEAAGREIPDTQAANDALPKDDGAAEAFGDAAKKHGTELAQVKANEGISLPAGIYLIVGNTTVPKVVFAEDEADVHADMKARRAPEFSLRISKDPGELAERVWLGSGEKAALYVEVSLPDDYDRYEAYRLGVAIEGGERINVDGEKATATVITDDIAATTCEVTNATPRDSTQITIEDLKETLPDYAENTKIVFEVPIEAAMGGADGKVSVSVLFGAEGEDCHKTEPGEVEYLSGTLSVSVEGAKADGSFVLEREGLGFAGEDGWTEKADDAIEYACEGGKIEIAGIAPGTYYLHQVSAPAGQRGSDEGIVVKVTSFASKLSATISGGLEGTSFDGVEEDVISITVINEPYEGTWTNTPGTHSADTAEQASSPVADMIANGAWALALAAVLVIVFLLMSKSAIRSRKQKEEAEEGENDD